MVAQKGFIAIFLSFTPSEIMPLCSTVGLSFIIIPAGGECPDGISNGVYFFGYLGWVTPSVGFPKDIVSRRDRG
jgi:hypothetical protein